MNCRLFSQHENYTTESQIVKLIYDIMILTARSMLLNLRLSPGRPSQP